MLLANALEQNHPPSIACFHSGWPTWHAERVPAGGRPVASRWPCGCRPVAGRWPARCRPAGAGAGRQPGNKNCILWSIMVCMHACNACMHLCMHACTYVCMHGCMYGCRHACMYACMHIHVHTNQNTLPNCELSKECLLFSFASSCGSSVSNSGLYQEKRGTTNTPASRCSTTSC